MSGSGLAPAYACVLSLVVAAQVRFGLAVWAGVWVPVVYRAARRGRGA